MEEKEKISFEQFKAYEKLAETHGRKLRQWVTDYDPKAPEPNELVAKTPEFAALPKQLQNALLGMAANYLAGYQNVTPAYQSENASPEIEKAGETMSKFFWRFDAHKDKSIRPLEKELSKKLGELRDMETDDRTRQNYVKCCEELGLPVEEAGRPKKDLPLNTPEIRRLNNEITDYIAERKLEESLKDLTSSKVKTPVAPEPVKEPEIAEPKSEPTSVPEKPKKTELDEYEREQGCTIVNGEVRYPGLFYEASEVDWKSLDEITDADKQKYGWVSDEHDETVLKDLRGKYYATYVKERKIKDLFHNCRGAVTESQEYKDAIAKRAANEQEFDKAKNQYDRARDILKGSGQYQKMSGEDRMRLLKTEFGIDAKQIAEWPPRDESKETKSAPSLAGVMPANDKSKIQNGSQQNFGR